MPNNINYLSSDYFELCISEEPYILWKEISPRKYPLYMYLYHLFRLCNFVCTLSLVVMPNNINYLSSDYFELCISEEPYILWKEISPRKYPLYMYLYHYNKWTKVLTPSSISHKNPC